MTTPRAVIYPKDVQRITGKSERYGRLLLSRIRHHHNKANGQYITIAEFAAYTGIPETSIAPYLK